VHCEDKGYGQLGEGAESSERRSTEGACAFTKKKSAVDGGGAPIAQ